MSWKCHKLVIGTGMYGSMPVMNEVNQKAKLRKIELLVLPTKEAINELKRDPEANAVLHLTC
jgi:hypothetical protein